MLRDCWAEKRSVWCYRWMGRGKGVEDKLACFTAMAGVAREPLKNISSQCITQGAQMFGFRRNRPLPLDIFPWTFCLWSLPGLCSPAAPLLSSHLIFSSCSANLFLFTKLISCYLFYYHISRGTFLDLTGSSLFPFFGGKERAEGKPRFCPLPPPPLPQVNLLMKETMSPEWFFFLICLRAQAVHFQLLHKGRKAVFEQN